MAVHVQQSVRLFYRPATAPTRINVELRIFTVLNDSRLSSLCDLTKSASGNVVSERCEILESLGKGFSLNGRQY